jgi:predicted RNase H-like HicB family nuclease
MLPATLTARYQTDPQDDRFWLVELIEEPRVHTYGLTLAEATLNLRDAICLWFDLASADHLILHSRFEPQPFKLPD